MSIHIHVCKGEFENKSILARVNLNTRSWLRISNNMYARTGGCQRMLNFVMVSFGYSIFCGGGTLQRSVMASCELYMYVCTWDSHVLLKPRIPFPWRLSCQQFARGSKLCPPQGAHGVPCRIVGGAVPSMPANDRSHSPERVLGSLASTRNTSELRDSCSVGSLSIWKRFEIKKTCGIMARIYAGVLARVHEGHKDYLFIFLTFLLLPSFGLWKNCRVTKNCYWL